ncbi:hypothetical protein AQ477_13985 [Burkholderia thailandensis]|nr:hypothetical protein AQ477_13985 [Burkholderia thailandensis]PNE74297.1 hypothetical protein A8H37_20975 [Burkholderia thailandensis]
MFERSVAAARGEDAGGKSGVMMVRDRGIDESTMLRLEGSKARRLEGSKARPTVSAAERGASHERRFAGGHEAQ